MVASSLIIFFSNCLPSFFSFPTQAICHHNPNLAAPAAPELKLPGALPPLSPNTTSSYIYYFSCACFSPYQPVRYEGAKLWCSIGDGDGGGLLGARAGGRGRLHAAAGLGRGHGAFPGDCLELFQGVGIVGLFFCNFFFKIFF